MATFPVACHAEKIKYMFDLLFRGFCAQNSAATGEVKTAAFRQEPLKSHDIKCELFDVELLVQTCLLFRLCALKKTEGSGTVETPALL